MNSQSAIVFLKIELIIKSGCHLFLMKCYLCDLLWLCSWDSLQWLLSCIGSAVFVYGVCQSVRQMIWMMQTGQKPWSCKISWPLLLVFLPSVYRIFKEVTSLLEIGNDRGWHHHQNRGGETYLLILAIWLCGFFCWGPSATTGSEIWFRFTTMPFPPRNCMHAVLNHNLKSKWVESAFHYTRA